MQLLDTMGLFIAVCSIPATSHVLLICIFGQITQLFHFVVYVTMYLKGRGTVVTGRVEQGTIKVGEDVEILGLMQVCGN